MPARTPEEARGLDPYADADEPIKRLAVLCEESGARISALPGQR